MLIFCGFMALGSVMLYPKSSDPEGGLSNPNARGFYGEPKNSIDLVVMGNSNAYSAYSPMLMSIISTDLSVTFISRKDIRN